MPITDSLKDPVVVCGYDNFISIGFPRPFTDMRNHRLPAMFSKGLPGNLGRGIPCRNDTLKRMVIWIMRQFRRYLIHGLHLKHYRNIIADWKSDMIGFAD